MNNQLKKRSHRDPNLSFEQQNELAIENIEKFITNLKKFLCKDTIYDILSLLSEVVYSGNIPIINNFIKKYSENCNVRRNSRTLGVHITGLSTLIYINRKNKKEDCKNDLLSIERAALLLLIINDLNKIITGYRSNIKNVLID
jgi:hypothetical protein